MNTKEKGSFGELTAAAHFIDNGWSVLFPYGENHRYDFVVEKDAAFLRVQVKFVTPRNGALEIACKSSNNWSVLPYSSLEIDILAIVDAFSKNVYFIPTSQINRSSIKLRLSFPKNNQKTKVRFASEYSKIPSIAA